MQTCDAIPAVVPSIWTPTIRDAVRSSGIAEYRRWLKIPRRWPRCEDIEEAEFLLRELPSGCAAVYLASDAVFNEWC